MEQLLRKVASKLGQKGITCRGIEQIDEDRVCIKALVKSGTPEAKVLTSAMRSLGLSKVNSAYGRWIFKIL